MSGGTIVQLGGIVGAAVAVRHLTVCVIALWSLRADPPGRRHALRLLTALGARRPPAE